MVTRLTYRPREVAEATGLSRETVLRMVRDGRLPSRRVGRAVLIPAEAVEALAGATGAEDAAPVSISPGARAVVNRLLS